ncbi:MAG: hypothetical protein ACRDS0_35335 [Pseudonocardiaceae bacterium]
MIALEGPAVSWLLTKLGPIGKWIKRRVTPDHLPIAGFPQGRPDRRYAAFAVFAAVAPSHTPKPLSPIDFVDRACELVEEAFLGDFPREPDYSGPGYGGCRLVRYKRVVDDALFAEHLISIHSTGLVTLQWIIAAPPTTTLPLAEAVAAVRRLHRAVQGSTFVNLHQHRRLARWRRVDWRIGVNGQATSPDGTSIVSWTDIVTAGLVPQQRTTDPYPSCPSTGYAADQLASLRRNVELGSILTPVLEELLHSGGYVNSTEIRQCVADLLVTRQQQRLVAHPEA